MGRKPDALKILGNLASEPDNAKNVDLQLRTASWLASSRMRPPSRPRAAA